MADNIFLLDESRRWFLEQGRIDPMTRERFRLGDHVVVCSGCDMVFLESTWQDCGGCVTPGCGGKRLKKQFLKAPPPKRTSTAEGLNRIVLRNGGVGRRERTAGEPPRMILRNAPPPHRNPPPAGDDGEAPRMIIKNIRHNS